MRKYTLCSLLLLFVLAITGCNDPQKSQTTALILNGKTMGTVWRVSLGQADPKQKDRLQQLIQQQLDRDEQELSTWKQDSVLSRFNQYAGDQPQPVSDNMAEIITVALHIGIKTQGAMDITVGPLVNLWGFGPEKAPVKIPTQTEIDSARARIGLRHLQVIQTSEGAFLQKNLPSLYVDLSTVGEGFATDHLARLMEKEGFSHYLVSVGGAILTRGYNAGGTPWRVAIQKPTDQENAVEAIVDLQGHGISTAGSYRNYYELEGKRLSHVIDPRSGQPVSHRLVSATVIATTALEADGWDTGLMVLGPEQAKALAVRQQLAVYLITKEKEGFSHWMSPQFAAFVQKTPQQ